MNLEVGGFNCETLLELQIVRRIVENEIESLDDSGEHKMSFLPGKRSTLQCQ